MTQVQIPSAIGLAAGLIATVVIFQVTRRLYDVFFGPLSKYPGPKLAKATRAVLAWHKLRGNDIKWTKSLHDKYGEVVQKSPNELSFADGAAWKDIYGHTMGTKTQQFPKDPKLYGRRPPGVYDIFWSNDVDHTRFRRNISHAFSDRALRQQEPIIRGYVDQLIARLSQQKGKVDMVKWYEFTTFDIMGDLAFGEPLGCLKKGEYTPWVTTLFANVKTILWLAEMEHVPLLKPLIRATLSKQDEKNRALHWKMSAEQVDKRVDREGEVTRPDIWGFVLNAKEKQQLTRPEMHANAQFLMLAGTETTGSLLSGLTWLLLTNPDKMEKVKQEIRSTFTHPDQINIETVLQLKFVNACFEEAMRCFPSVPSAMPRLIPKGGDYVLGEWIPEDTIVGVSQWSTNYNPRMFHRPTEFIPERWLDERDPEFAKDNKAARQPFGFGPRNCLGSNLAYLEMRLIFANMLLHYDMSLGEESNNWIDAKVYTLWEKNPLMVNLTPVRPVAQIEVA